MTSYRHTLRSLPSSNLSRRPKTNYRWVLFQFTSTTSVLAALSLLIFCLFHEIQAFSTMPAAARSFLVAKKSSPSLCLYSIIQPHKKRSTTSKSSSPSTWSSNDTSARKPNQWKDDNKIYADQINLCDSKSSNEPKKKGNNHVESSSAVTKLSQTSPSPSTARKSTSGDTKALSVASPAKNITPTEWIFTFADLSPDSPQTRVGQAFLATNLFYAAAGVALQLKGDWWLGGWTEIAAVASFNYHFRQLEISAVTEQQKQKRSMESQRSKIGNVVTTSTSTTRSASDVQTVQLALLTDYFVAGINILTALGYAFYILWLNITGASANHGVPQVEPEVVDTIIQSVQCGTVAVAFLLLCWKYEQGRPYMIFHSAWHLFSAYAGYLVGTAFTMTDS